MESETNPPTASPDATSTISAAEKIVQTSKLLSLPTEIRNTIYDLELLPRYTPHCHPRSPAPVTREELIRSGDPRRTLPDPIQHLQSNETSSDLKVRHTLSNHEQAKLGLHQVQEAGIYDIQKKLGLKHTPYYHAGASQITEYMNTHLDQGATFSEFAEYSPRCRHLVSPAWFNHESDILFVKFGSGKQFTTNLPPKKLTFEKLNQLRHLAVEKDSWHEPRVLGQWRGASYEYVRGWYDACVNSIMKIDNSNIGMATVGGHRAYAEFLMKIDDSYINLASLKSVTLIERVKCEIVVVTRDEKHEVEPKQWAFSLDTESETFRAEMAGWWSGVTWRVKLAKDGGKGLLSLLGEWYPNIMMWEQEKRRLCMDNAKVGQKWKDTEKKYFPKKKLGRKMRLVENGDGKTYLGTNGVPPEDSE